MIRRTFLLLLLPCLLAGCGGGGGGAPSVPSSVATTTPEGLRITLRQARDRIDVGDALTYTATLTNTSSQPVEVEVQPAFDTAAGPVVNLRVVSPSGQRVANFQAYSSSRPFFAPLQPGESFSSSFKVERITVPDAPFFAERGVYEATAFLLLRLRSETQARSFPVGPLRVTVR